MMKFSFLFLLGLGLHFALVAPVFAADVESGLIKKNAYKTSHFSIEFSDLIFDQADKDRNDLPDVVDIIAEAAEYSRTVVIDDLNYPDPMEGTNRKTIIILDDRDQYLSPGALGVTSLLSNKDPYIAVDPWLSEAYMKITIGHEYFHTVQFAYDDEFAYYNQGIHWAEATAVWMEEILYDANDDYVNYISEYFDHVDYSIFASVLPVDTLFEYGLNVWPLFLSEYFNAGIIKDIWEEYVGTPLPYDDDRKIYNAVHDIVAEHGQDLRTVYRDFSLWNLDLLQYAEGRDYPDVHVIESETGEDYQEIDEDFAPALFGSNYLYFDNSRSEESFYFHVAKPEGISFAVTLIPTDGGSVDLVRKKSLILERDEFMETTLELDDLHTVDGVYAIVSPLDTALRGTDDFDAGYLYGFFAEYSKEGEDFSAMISTGSEISEEGSSTDIKEGDTQTEGVRISDSLTLTIQNYDEDSVNFSWNRLIDSDIVSYVMRYGIKSSVLDQEVFVDRASITALTVEDLELGKKYYFELAALDENGKEVGEPSPVLAVTPEKWVFSDVSFFDDHYNAIAALTEGGIFSGYSNGSFQPEKDLNRAELLKILVEGRDLQPSSSTYKNCFTDVSSQWYAGYVCYAKAQGWVKGYSDGSFKPAAAVSKVEALKILLQVYEAGVKDGAVTSELSYPDLNPTAWYARYVEKASELGLLEETPGEPFEPANSRLRGEMAEELYRYLVTSGQI